MGEKKVQLSWKDRFVRFILVLVGLCVLFVVGKNLGVI